MRNISIVDNLKIEEQNKEERMRARNFKHCSLEADRWKIEEQNEQNRVKASKTSNHRNLRSATRSVPDDNINMW